MQAGVRVLARVECRDESRPQERPVAVWVGGTRLAVRAIIEDATLGGVEAGEAARRWVVVELEDGVRLELVRVLPAGEWRAYRQPDRR